MTDSRTLDLNAVVPQADEFISSRILVQRCAPVLRQRLTAAVGPAHWPTHWVYLDYHNNGETTLKVLIDEDESRSGSSSFPWDEIGEGCGETILFDRQATCDPEYRTWWLGSLTVDSADRGLWEISLAALAQMYTEPLILPSAALCVLQMHDTLTNTVAGTSWVTIDDGLIADESPSLIEALASWDVIDGGGHADVPLIAQAYRDGRYDLQEPSGAKVQIIHSTAHDLSSATTDQSGRLDVPAAEKPRLSRDPEFLEAQRCRQAELEGCTADPGEQVPRVPIWAGVPAVAVVAQVGVLLVFFAAPIGNWAADVGIAAVWLLAAVLALINRSYRPRMSRGDRRRWRATRSLADVAAVTALWLEGKVQSQPNYEPGYGPDEETAPLVPMLAAWNRAGFLTDGSQPGDLEECAVQGTLWRQRAAVEGYIDRYTGSRIMAAAIEAGLWVVVDGVTVHGEPFIADGQCWGAVVTEMERQPHTWFGAHISGEWRDVMYEKCGYAAQKAIREALRLTVIDPEYDRNDVLWPVVNDALLSDRSVKAS
jgi:hypothetical protein